jgi:hypothetical protein
LADEVYELKSGAAVSAPGELPYAAPDPISYAADAVEFSIDPRLENIANRLENLASHLEG